MEQVDAINLHMFVPMVDSVIVTVAESVERNLSRRYSGWYMT